MNIKPCTYSLSLRLNPEFDQGLEMRNFYIPADIIKKIFIKINDGTLKTENSILLTCKSFLVIGINIFSDLLYSQMALMKIFQIRSNVATFYHYMEKNNNAPYVLKEAVTEGYMNVFNEIHQKFNFSWADIVSFAFSLEKTSYRILFLKKIIEDLKFDPTLNDNLLFYEALKHNDRFVINYLLENQCFDPSWQNNKMIKDILRQNHINSSDYETIVCTMLEDHRVDPFALSNSILLILLKSNKIWDGVLNFLLQHPKLDLSVNQDIIETHSKKYLELAMRFSNGQLKNTKSLEKMGVVPLTEIYSLNVPCDGIVNTFENSPFSMLPNEKIVEIFKACNEYLTYSNLKSLVNLTKTCKLFLAIGLEVFEKNIYNTTNLRYIISKNKNINTLKHLLAKTDLFYNALSYRSGAWNLNVFKLLLSHLDLSSSKNYEFLINLIYSSKDILNRDVYLTELFKEKNFNPFACDNLLLKRAVSALDINTVCDIFNLKKGIFFRDIINIYKNFRNTPNFYQIIEGVLIKEFVRENNFSIFFPLNDVSKNLFKYIRYLILKDLAAGFDEHILLDKLKNKDPNLYLINILSNPSVIIELNDLEEILSFDIPLKFKNQCVEKVLLNPLFEPSVNSNHLLKLLMKHGLYLQMNKLIKHPKIDFSNDRDTLIALSEEYRQNDIATNNSGIWFAMLTDYLRKLDVTKKQ